MSIRNRFGALVVGAVLIGGCTAEAPEEEAATDEMAEAGAEAAAAAASVTVVSPASGSEVAGPDVHVMFQVAGLQVAPAGTMEPGTGHHHIFLDTEVTPLDQPIPMNVPGIVHLGQAQTEHHFEGVAPGQHRIIAVVADGAHIPLNPPVVDTVVFTVTAP